MLHIIKQIKGSFISLLENKFDWEWFQVFDGAKDWIKDSRVDAQELHKIATQVYKLEWNNAKRNELIKELNKRINQINWGAFDNSENSQKYFDNLVNKYSDLFKQITEQKDNVSDNIKWISKVERKKVSNEVSIKKTSGKLKTKSDVVNAARDSSSNIAEKSIRHSNKKEVERKISNHEKELDNTSKLLDYSKWIQSAINDIAENESEGYSLTRAFNELVWNNDEGKIILKELNKEEKFIEANSAKVERALETLNLYKNVWATSENRNWISWVEDRKFSIAKNFICKAGAVLKVISKALPWATWVYLTDANIPWTSKIVPGLDLNKSLALQEWINGGMEWEFVYNKEKADFGRNAVETAWDLKSTLTTYVGSKASEKFLSWKISALSVKEKNVIKKALANIIEPQLEFVNNESFHGGPINWIMDTLLSNDAKNADKLLENFSKIIKENGSLDNIFNQADKIIEWLEEEDDWASRDAVKSNKNKVNFFKELHKSNKDLNKISKLLSLGQNNLSILKKFENKEDFISAYGLQDFAKTINKVHTAIEKGDTNTLKNLKKWEKQLFSAIWTDKLGEFKLRFLQKTKRLDANVKGWKYGMDLTNANWSEAYKLLSKYWVEKNLNTVQTLFKGLINTSKINNVWLSEFDNALKKLNTVSISELHWKVLNTSKSGQGALTTFESGLDKNDKNVKHTYIDKEFTYYQWGNKITEKVRYNIYLRPECSNLLVVPEAIEWTKKVTKAPKLDNAMYNEIPLTTPIVIAYSIINKLTKKGTRTKEVERTWTKTEERTWTRTETRTWTRQQTTTTEVEVQNPHWTSNPDVTWGQDNATWGVTADVEATTSSTSAWWDFGNGQTTTPSATTWTWTTTSTWTGIQVPTHETITTTVNVPYTYTVNVPYTYTIEVPYTYMETVIEEFTYKVSKSAGRKLAESFAASIDSGLTQEYISKALSECAVKNNIPAKELKTFVKEDIPRIYSKAKNLQKATSPVARIDDPKYNKKPEVKLNSDIYTIKSGDTLSKIAKENKTSVKKLVELNKIKDANKIRIGQKIKVK